VEGLEIEVQGKRMKKFTNQPFHVKIPQRGILTHDEFF
jgi:hypothetical protein